MKIAFLCPDFVTCSGGAQLHCRRLAEELCALGNHVTILTNYSKETEVDVSQKNVQICQLKDSKWLNKYGYVLSKIKEKRGGRRFLHLLFGNNKYDLIIAGPHCSGIGKEKTYKEYDAVGVFLSGTCCWGLQLQKITKKQNKIFAAFPLFHVRMPHYNWNVQKSIHKNFDLIITNTAFEERFLQSKGWDGNKIAVGGVGSDLTVGASGSRFRNKYGIPEDAPIILFLGRKNYHKGVTHLIEAMEFVWEQFPNTWLVLIGFMQNSKQWIDDYLEKSKHDAPHKTLDLYDVSVMEREDALAAATLMALPSINDSFGIAYLDAWRYKLPVIGCSDTSSESVIADEKNGLLVTFGDNKTLASAMLSLLSDEQVRLQMGARGYNELVRSHSWDIVARRINMKLREYLNAEQP